METLERVRGGGRMPLLMLGEAAGRWERFQTDQENCWDTDEEKEKNNGELDIRASVVVESEKDQSVNGQLHKGCEFRKVKKKCSKKHSKK